MDYARRRFISGTAALSLSAVAGVAVGQEPRGAAASSAPFTLQELPWKPSALAPLLSTTTVDLHYGKHHAGYLANLNRALPGSRFENMTLQEVVRASAKDPDARAIFNNAAQVANHDFYWKSLAPNGGGKPPASLRESIEFAFGDLAGLKKEFLVNSASQFGSGWVWLVYDRSMKRLAVIKTSNADTPATSLLFVPLAVVDVWEHAYYVDYQNRRAEYAEAIFDKALNWGFVESNLGNITT